MKDHSNHHRRHFSRAARRSGFTLVELLVVIAIAAAVTAITVGGFKEVSSGHKRTGCQTNLVQIYQACRLYAADQEGAFPGFPYSNKDAAMRVQNVAELGGIGLWQLYTYPEINVPERANPSAPPSPNLPGPAVETTPVERYLRSAKSLHCPNDYDHEERYIDPTPPNTLRTFNPSYLSYQNETPTAMNDDGLTYQSVRTKDQTDVDWKRQLIHYNGNARVIRPPDSDTVVTWCPWHRRKNGGSRDYDNVLFYDGTVRLLPMIQNGVVRNGIPRDGLMGWRRFPQTP